MLQKWPTYKIGLAICMATLKNWVVAICEYVFGNLCVQYLQVKITIVLKWLFGYKNVQLKSDIHLIREPVKHLIFLVSVALVCINMCWCGQRFYSFNLTVFMCQCLQSCVYNVNVNVNVSVYNGVYNGVNNHVILVYSNLCKLIGYTSKKNQIFSWFGTNYSDCEN